MSLKRVILLQKISVSSKQTNKTRFEMGFLGVLVFFVRVFIANPVITGSLAVPTFLVSEHLKGTVSRDFGPSFSFGKKSPGSPDSQTKPVWHLYSNS
jgi:hypothetical protein